MRTFGEGVTMRKMLLAAILLGAMIAPAQADPPAGCSGFDVNDPRTTDGADFLTGTEDRDVVAAGDGPDQYFAAEGPDVLCGNQGDDVLVGEAGNDDINGGTGGDTLSGMGGADDVAGAGGPDELQGGAGDDRLLAALEDDARDDLYDGEGSDVIVGNGEDFWHRCPDEETDDHDAFTGTVVTEPIC